MENTHFLRGSRVWVTSYSPFRGLSGTIRIVDAIPVESEEPFCFYLIALEGAHIQEPVWFAYDEVELLSEPLPHHHSTGNVNIS